jgi:outer membrane protein assembly factor BamB
MAESNGSVTNGRGQIMSRCTLGRIAAVLTILALFAASPAFAAESWTQLKYDSRHSGNAPGRSVTTPLGLIGAVPLTDAVFTSPVVADGRVYVVDGSGAAFCLDAKTLRILWKFPSRGGAANCNNVSSPALAGRYLHFGTMAGTYYVLDAAKGTVVKEIACGEPIFSAPVVSEGRVYFATLGSRVYAVKPDGTVCWTWDYVKEVLGFRGDRWSGEAWRAHKRGRATWRDQFACSRDLAASGRMLAVPAGGSVVWLRDAGGAAEFRGVGLVPKYKGSERPGIFGLSLDESGGALVQWHRRDNTGRVERLRRHDRSVETSHVRGTLVQNDLPGLLSFCSVSPRGRDVYRCRPETGFGLCRHSPSAEPQVLGGPASICPPILLRDRAVYGGLDGSLHVVPLAGGQAWSFKTAFGKAVSAPPAVCDGRIYFGCEDGYLYVLGPGGTAPLPTKGLRLWQIRSPLTGRLAGAKHNWFTNYGDLANTNANDQGLRPPFKVRWIRRFEGTYKHLPICGGGRTYAHTAEGQIFAVEQETGRLLWRRHFPDVYVSFTSPIYHDERLLVPQAGLKKSRMRCLDAATGELIWEAPFTGSPSWTRQLPPIVHKGLAIYLFGTGTYAPKGTGIYVFGGGRGDPAPPGTPEIMSWLYSHDNPTYPKEHEELRRVRFRRRRRRHVPHGRAAVLLLLLRLRGPSEEGRSRREGDHRGAGSDDG